jgi:hypothetical protein
MMQAKTKQADTLADHVGHKVSVICEECEILKRFDGKKLFELHGDANMPGLLETLSRSLGCERPKSGFYDRCKLVYYFTHDEWIKRTGLVSREEHEIALGKRLADLHEWEVINAHCRCGHIGRLNRKSLERKYGFQARIKELAPKLLCQDCKKYDSVIQISSLPR